jgi:hypothetical protein
MKYNAAEGRCKSAGFSLTRSLVWLPYFETLNWVTPRPLLCPREMWLNYAKKNFDAEVFESPTGEEKGE